MCSTTRARMATPGPARVAFGAPLRLQGEDYAALAKPVEDAVRELGSTERDSPERRNR